MPLNGQKRNEEEKHIEKSVINKEAECLSQE